MKITDFMLMFSLIQSFPVNVSEKEWEELVLVNFFAKPCYKS